MIRAAGVAVVTAVRRTSFAQAGGGASVYFTLPSLSIQRYCCAGANPAASSSASKKAGEKAR